MLVTVAGEKKKIEQGTTIAKLIEIEKVACVYTDDNIPSKIEDYLNKRNIKVIKTE